MRKGALDPLRSIGCIGSTTEMTETQTTQSEPEMIESRQTGNETYLKRFKAFEVVNPIHPASRIPCLLVLFHFIFWNCHCRRTLHPGD